MWLTLQGLAAAGHEIMLVAPGDGGPDADAQVAALGAVCTPCLVSAARRSWPAAAVGALRHGQALTVARHHLPAVEQAVADAIASWRPDVLHVEQLQALANCSAARKARIPILLRMQNVESSLWQQVAGARVRSRPLHLEARRLRKNEAGAVHDTDCVVALTERDASALRLLAPEAAGAGRVLAITPPFPALLPAGAPVPGSPAIVLAGSAGWWPNTEGMHWFLNHVAPLLAAAAPAARIHIYGGAAIRSASLPQNILWHPAPDDAVDAFPTGAIAAIPLHIGSGIRMRILEAWARGLPVVASPVAVAGLQAESGRELLIAEGAADFTQAILHLARDPVLRAALVQAGRSYLVSRHDSVTQTSALVSQHDRLIGDVRSGR